MSRFSDLLPKLWPEEYEALKADIAERGVLVPLEVDEDGEILDGAHRARAAAELGLAPPARIVRRGLTEEGKRAHALALNIHRRQLMASQRRELVARLRAEGLSTRRIAEATGIPQSTVDRDARAGDPAGSPEVVTGADGKVYPATQPRSEAWRAEDLLGAPARAVPAPGPPAPPTSTARPAVQPVLIGHNLIGHMASVAQAIRGVDLDEVMAGVDASERSATTRPLWFSVVDDLIAQLEEWRRLLSKRELRRVK